MIMKRFRVGIAALCMMFGLVAFAHQGSTSAINVSKGCSGGEVCKELKNTNAVNPLVRTLIGTMLFILGTISVIMIIVGGIKYTTSNGDQAKVTSAKNTILYAVVGLVVALLAYAIVNFVIAQF